MGPGLSIEEEVVSCTTRSSAAHANGNLPRNTGVSSQITGVNLTNKADAIRKPAHQVADDTVMVEDVNKEETDEDNDDTVISPPMIGCHDEDSDRKNEDEKKERISTSPSTIWQGSISRIP